MRKKAALSEVCKAFYKWKTFGLRKRTAFTVPAKLSDKEKTFFSAQRHRLRTAPKLTCSNSFQISLATVSLLYTFSFSKNISLASVVQLPFRTDSKPLRRRFAGKTGFGRSRRKFLQNHFRQSFESLPGVQRFANLNLLETWSPCSRPFAILPVSAVSDAQKLATGNFLCVRACFLVTFCTMQKVTIRIPLQGASRFCKPRISIPQPQFRTATIKTFLRKLRGSANLESAHKDNTFIQT